MPSSSQGPDRDHTRQWELSEDGGGFLRPQNGAHSEVTHVFSHTGALLTSTPDGVSNGPETTSAGARLGRLLRYYMGNAGRRVFLQDDSGMRWAARITNTRWRSKGQGRLWSFVSTGRKTPSAAPEQDTPDSQTRR